MKVLKWFYAVLVSVIVCIPVFTMPLFAQDSNEEKRDLAPFPSLMTEDGFNNDFTTQLETWLSEHFSFRSQLVTGDSVLRATFFQTSSEEQVLIGRDNWLYFSETLDDYQGNRRISDVGIAHLTKMISLVEEYVSASGCHFVFTVAPNKNSIYPEYMPYYCLRTSTPTDLDAATAALSGTAGFVDLKAVLSAARADTQLYHKRDTHWNNAGALLAYQAIMQNSDLTPVDFASAGQQIKTDFPGDLDAMLFPGLGKLDEQIHFNHKFDYSYLTKFRSEEDILIKTKQKRAEGNLLVFRDSFCNALLPLFADSFQTATFTRAFPFVVDTTEKDLVVMEVAERNLSNLLKYAPVMPAPIRRDIAASAMATEELTINTREKSGYCHFYGTLPANIAADAVYVQVMVDGETSVYEAFPIFENSLLGDRQTATEQPVADNGFSVYLDSACADAGQVTLLVSSQNTVTAYSCQINRGDV